MKATAIRVKPPAVRRRGVALYPYYHGFKVGTGLAFNANKSAVINFTRRSHLRVRDVACEGSGFPVSGVGRYLGFVLGPDSLAVRRAAVRV